MSTDSRPPPPFLDIKPCPEQVAMCRREILVYGFPISHEWFSVMYDGLKRKGLAKEYSEEFLATATLLADLCQTIYPSWRHISVVMVVCGDYGEYGSCALIRIGTAGWRPLNETVIDMAKELRKYGLTEKPNWFPGLDLKSMYASRFMILANHRIIRRFLITPQRICVALSPTNVCTTCEPFVTKWRLLVTISA